MWPGDSGQVGIRALAQTTYLGNWGTDSSILVTLPFYGTLHPSDIASDILRYCSSPLRRHKTFWTKQSPKFWSDRPKETWYAKDSGRIVTSVDNLGIILFQPGSGEESLKGSSRRPRVPVPQRCELPLVSPHLPDDLLRRPEPALPTEVLSPEAKSDDLWVSSFLLA